jgi:hypothetical protein
VQTDDHNCGDCGVDCTARGLVCLSGQCSPRPS